MTSPHKKSKCGKPELPLVLESEPKKKANPDQREYIHDEYDIEAYEIDNPGSHLEWNGEEYVRVVDEDYE